MFATSAFKMPTATIVFSIYFDFVITVCFFGELYGNKYKECFQFVFFNPQTGELLPNNFSIGEKRK